MSGGLNGTVARAILSAMTPAPHPGTVNAFRDPLGQRTSVWINEIFKTHPLALACGTYALQNGSRIADDR